MNPSVDTLASNLNVLDRLHFCPSIKDVDTDEFAFAQPAEVFEAKNGQCTMRCFDDSGEFLVHSRFDPQAEAKIQIEAAGIDENINVAIVFGFGCGHIVRQLLSEVDSKTKIVIVEPDLNSLCWYLMHVDETELLQNDRVNIVGVTDPISAASAVMPHLALLTLKGWLPIISPPFMRKHSEFMTSFARELDQQTATQKLGFATSADTSHLFMTNAFLNSKYAAGSPGLLQLKECWKGRPAILISAGPSLEKQLPLLAEVKDHFLLISMGASLRTLRAAHIEPHIVVTVDPFPIMYDHFKGVKSEGAWLLSDMAGNPNIVSDFSEKRLFGHSTPQMEFLFSKLFGQRGLMISGGSVANSAFSAAAVMQADPIILIGQDLAYTGGASHAAGNVKRLEINDELVAKNPQKYKKIPGYYGDEVVTDDKMNSYRIWFERVIPSISMSRIINATEGGCMIHGAENMPFKDVVDQFLPDRAVDFDDVVSSLPNFKATDERSFRANVLRLRRQVRTIDKVAGEAADAAKNIMEATRKGLEESEIDRYKVLFNRALKTMRRQKGAGDLFVTGFVQKGILYIQRRQALFHENEQDETFTNYTYQLTLKNACKQAEQLLKDFLKKTKAPKKVA